MLLNLALHLSAELEWVGDVTEGFIGAAGSAYSDAAKTQHAPEQSLLDADALHFREEELDGAFGEESDFDDDALGFFDNRFHAIPMVFQTFAICRLTPQMIRIDFTD